MPRSPLVEELLEWLAQHDALIDALSAERGHARLRIRGQRWRRSRPDEVITHEAGCCRGCGDDLGGAVEVGREHWQVFDIPPMRVRVIERPARHQGDGRRRGVARLRRRRVYHTWAPYDTYPALTHALCIAHALRELQAVTDTTPEGQWCWAQQCADSLRELNQLVKDALASRGSFEASTLPLVATAIHRYRSAALLGVEATRTRATN